MALTSSPAAPETYRVETVDGWRLAIHRHRPGREAGLVPLLAVHGLSQTSTTWTSGGLARELARLGVDVHLLELRGHGSSSPAFQRPGADAPSDLEYGWNVDSFFYKDLPAAINGCLARSGREGLVLCGHSMGGIVAAGAALRDPRVRGLAAVAAPFEPGRARLRVRLAAGAADLLLRGRRPQRVPKALRRLPFDLLFKGMNFVFHPLPATGDLVLKAVDLLDPRQLVVPRLWHSATTPREVAETTLRQCEPVAAGVLAQLASWTSSNRIHTLGPAQDLTARFSELRMPLLLVHGDRDLLAPRETSLRLARSVASSHLRTVVLAQCNHICTTSGRHGPRVAALLRDLTALAADWRP